MTSSKQHFQNLRKVSSQIFYKIMWSKFHQNRTNSVQIKGCDRQTDTQTHIYMTYCQKVGKQRVLKLESIYFTSKCVLLVVLDRICSSTSGEIVPKVLSENMPQFCLNLQKTAKNGLKLTLKKWTLVMFTLRSLHCLHAKASFLKQTKEQFYPRLAK